jgi:hypothetical protein
MTFAKGNCYLLTDITSAMKNPLHEKIVGHLCELRAFTENEFGWFRVDLEDGTHSICTSIVNRVELNDDDSVTVSTANSVYHFELIHQPMDAECVERMCEPAYV